MLIIDIHSFSDFSPPPNGGGEKSTDNNRFIIAFLRPIVKGDKNHFR